MCGRFTLIEGIYELMGLFEFEFTDIMIPSYNIAPSQRILTVVSDQEKRVGSLMKWGLVPYWAKEEKMGYKMINARAEGIESKPSFKVPFQRKRCLILADSFYEWKKTETGKIPYRFVMKDEKPFAFAGLWDTWYKASDPLSTCTIITTIPNSVTIDVHDRMPVILPPEAYDDWLNPKQTNINELKKLLVPYPANQMKKYPVSTLVNSVKNNSRELIAPNHSI
ncbi:SOS response-associated peptidase [Bacillus sp. 03113]|uniref:SOS response-associated peptidase n=1 Tax=Bacillus sp. 03113 TaxID=2578211 RepID=UPI00114257E6|nr:SOS response-associated peptidase [Bacillus sp. 03113]